MDQNIEFMMGGQNGRISHLFRNESHFTDEGKGGFLKGYIKINGIDDEREQIQRIALSLDSKHPTKMHCNLLRVSINSFEKELHQNVLEAGRNSTMSPSAYKVILLSSSDGNTFKIDRNNHEYLPINCEEAQFWDKNFHTLNLGDNPGLCLNIVKPLSRSEPESKLSKNFIHIRQVIETRKREELELEIDENFSDLTKNDKQQKILRDMDDFKKTELNSTKQKKKKKLLN